MLTTFLPVIMTMMIKLWISLCIQGIITCRWDIYVVITCRSSTFHNASLHTLTKFCRCNIIWFKSKQMCAGRILESKTKDSPGHNSRRGIGKSFIMCAWFIRSTPVHLQILVSVLVVITYYFQCILHRSSIRCYGKYATRSCPGSVVRSRYCTEHANEFDHFRAHISQYFGQALYTHICGWRSSNVQIGKPPRIRRCELHVRRSNMLVLPLCRCDCAHVR